jgi:hypothetical protein
MTDLAISLLQGPIIEGVPLTFDRTGWPLDVDHFEESGCGQDAEQLNFVGQWLALEAVDWLWLVEQARASSRRQRVLRGRTPASQGRYNRSPGGIRLHKAIQDAIDRAPFEAERRAMLEAGQVFAVDVQTIPGVGKMVVRAVVEAPASTAIP